MKNTNYFLIFICMISLFVFSSCEQTELQRSTSNTDEKINTRTDDCDDCPMGDCCCFMEWVSGGPMSIQLCGTTGSRLSTSECEFTDVGSCFDVANGYILGPFTVTMGTKQLFCMGENSSFCIHVLSGSGTIKFTCQAEDTSPQTITLNVSAPNRYFYSADGDCELADCN
jgi:hypothetical protein